MRICIVTKYLPPDKTDGIPRNRWEYARQFSRLGHEVHIVTSGNGYVEETISNIFIHKIPTWNEKVYNSRFKFIDLQHHCKDLLCYSYLVYDRIKELNEKIGLDIIDSPLWDLEGYVTKIMLPGIPMIVRLESTSMLIREIKERKFPIKDDQNHLETHFLKIADAYVFDSWSIFKETERLYEIDLTKRPSALIYHGIKLESLRTIPVPVLNNEKKFRVLIAGRMERRKGTDIILFDVLPEALLRMPEIEFHFVGGDNAEWDGFLQETGLTYTDYIKLNFSAYIGRNIYLHGYVSDDEFEGFYDKADCVLAPSRYESFGLLYVEAMRKNCPLVVFNTGAVPELFESGVDALVVHLDEPGKIVDALNLLKNDPVLRVELATNAQKKLYSRFSAERMGEECVAFFEQIMMAKGGGRVLQVMNALSDGDGVSNIVIDYDSFFKKEAIDTQIVGTWSTEKVKHLRRAIEEVDFSNNDIILYHYWNYCDRGDYFNSLKHVRKAFLFHNMTSPFFFEKDDPAYEATFKGFQQLKALDNFDVYVGFSSYSLKILEQTIRKPIRTFLLPPIIDKNVILARPYNKNLSGFLEKDQFNLLFVGRICSNKKQTDLVDFISYYKKINANAHIYIVGGGQEKYVTLLRKKIKDLELESCVSITGKVPDEDLYAYYRNSDVFLSMSEHEGFGVPFVEAMVFGIPVIAYSCTAIPDTVGDHGGLFYEKNFEKISDLIERVRVDQGFKTHLVECQFEHIKKFSIEAFREKYSELRTLMQTEFIKKNADILVSDIERKAIVNYDDHRILRIGDWKLMDDQVIKIDSHKERSMLILEAEFDFFTIEFLRHKWSGVMKVTVDNTYVEMFDLYSDDSRLYTFEPKSKFSRGRHLLRIEALSRKNSMALAFEVLFSKITFSGNEFMPRVYDASNTADFGVDKNIQKGSVESYKEKRVLRNEVTVQSQDSLLKYIGNWETRDGIYKYSSGVTQDNRFIFEVTCSHLELGFISHSWSGIVKVEVEDVYTEVIDLYDTGHNTKYVRIAYDFSQITRKVTVSVLDCKNEKSADFQVFFKEIILHTETPFEVDEHILEKEYKVSVNINTLNRCTYLEELLGKLEEQSYPYFEVVVVNGPSKDDTDKVLEKYANRIKIGHCPEANLSKSRNIGIELSAGNYVAFIDDDAIPCDRFWLENFVYFLVSYRGKNSNIGCVGGPVKHRDTIHFEFKNGATSDYGAQIFREEEMENVKLDGIRWVQGVRGANNINLKQALYDIGGFDEKFVYYLDETDVCFRICRAGYSIVNHASNFVRHYSGNGEFRKSQYDLKWDVIARSDTYFCLKTSTDVMIMRVLKTCKNFFKKHFYKDVGNAYRNGEISRKDYYKYRMLMWKGFSKGLAWGLFSGKESNYLNKKSDVFLLFAKNEKNVAIDNTSLVN